MIAERYPRNDINSTEFSDREQEVLQGLLDGLTSKRIGIKLGVSESSVKAILQRLFAKLGVRTRSQIVRAALERGARR